MSLESLHERVQMDLSYLNINYTDTWVPQTKHIKNHVYDVVIVGGGQSGLGAGFALLREKSQTFSLSMRITKAMKGHGRLMQEWLL